MKFITKLNKLRHQSIGSNVLFGEHLHEKAEESRHNETIGYFTIVVGSVFFVGGLLATMTTVENPEWFGIIPYHLTPHPYSLLSLSLTLVGIALLIIGTALGIHYARERSWYMQELRKVHSMEEQKLGLERKVETRVQWPEMAETTVESKTEDTGQ